VSAGVRLSATQLHDLIGGGGMCGGGGARAALDRVVPLALSRNLGLKSQ
jgi:hypothetical protein